MDDVFRSYDLCSELSKELYSELTDLLGESKAVTVRINCEASSTRVGPPRERCRRAVESSRLDLCVVPEELLILYCTSVMI